MFRGTPCMMKSTVSPLQTLFKLVWTNVFEKLLEPKTLFRQGTECHKVDVDIDVLAQNGFNTSSKKFEFCLPLLPSEYSRVPSKMFSTFGAAKNRIFFLQKS